MEALAQQADDLAPPLGEGVTDADVAERQAQQEAPEQTNAELLTGAIQLVRDTVTQLAGVQSIQQTMANPVTEQLGGMWGRVLDRYGIRLHAYMGRHGELIMATIATLAIGRGVLAGYRAERAAQTERAAPEAAPLPDVPAA